EFEQMHPPINRNEEIVCKHIDEEPEPLSMFVAAARLQRGARNITNPPSPTCVPLHFTTMLAWPVPIFLHSSATLPPSNVATKSRIMIAIAWDNARVSPIHIRSPAPNWRRCSEAGKDSNKCRVGSMAQRGSPAEVPRCGSKGRAEWGL